MNTICVIAVLMMVSGLSLASEITTPPDEVLATRTVESFGQKVTLADTKRMEAGRVLYCSQRVGGAYTDPKTQKVVVQLVSACQVGELAK